MRIIILLLAAVGLLTSACQDSEPQRQVTAEGFDYIVHTSTGAEQPEPTDYVVFHAQIRKGDSVVYRTRESNPQPPALQIPAEGVPSMQGSFIEGVLRVMAVGDSATLFIPLDSLPQTPPDFVGEENMIYDIVVTEIMAEEAFMAYQQELQAAAAAAAEAAKTEVDGIVAQYRAGGYDDQIQTTDSGLRYIPLEEGTGTAAEAGDMVSVDYYGITDEGGEMFDNSYRRGAPFTFPLGQGQVIPGWDEGIDLMAEGGEALLLIPSDLGYGEAGNPPIPPNADLIFYVDLVKVAKQ